jgi:hypothetical protein
MTARREFIGGVASTMAGLVFVGCDLVNSTHVHAQGGLVRRREVVVNGRRVKTVDMHAHCAFPQAMALMGMKLDTENLVVGAERIRAMDEQGIDVEALSINPYWYKADRDVAQALINMQNEKLAELCAAQPASGNSDCAALRSAGASTASNSPTHSFIRFGPRPKNSGV